MHLTKGERLSGGIFLLTTSSLTFFDAISDIAEGSSWRHILVELTSATLLFIAFVGLVWTLRRRMSGLLENAQHRAVLLQAEAERWKEEASLVKGRLSRAIESQFALWQLTQAEGEIARLILKGLSNKEVALLRNSSEQTVKQQAHAVYKKSGLESRSQLLAFFLEDLF